MAGYFNKLRKKPKHVRDNIAFSAAGGITFIVAVAWFLVGYETPIRNTDTAVEEKPAAFSTLLDQIQEQVATVREGVSGETEVSTATTSPEAPQEWGIAAMEQTTTTRAIAREAAIMIISASSSRAASSTASSTSVLY